MLFNLYSELIMRHALEKWEDGIEIGGKLYNNLRYADDVALLATTEGKLPQLVNAVGKASERFGLSLNSKKTQVIIIIMFMMDPVGPMVQRHGHRPTHIYHQHNVQWSPLGTS